MALGSMTRKWLVTIIVAITVVLVAVWIYTTWAAEEVEPEVPSEAAVQQVGAASLAVTPQRPSDTARRRIG